METNLTVKNNLCRTETNNSINKLTLIMQNYNTPENKLMVALDSVFDQTYKNFNFVFIDDWSTDYDASLFFEKWDKTWEHKKFEGKFYKVIKPQDGPFDELDHNHGHSFCRNWGLNLIDTEYVMFMDSDDALTPVAIETLIKGFSVESDIDISIGNFTRDVYVWFPTCDFVRHIEKDYKHQYKTYNSLDALDILCDPYMLPEHRPTKPSVAFCATWNKIFRKSLFDEISFPNGRTKDDNFTAHRLLWKARKICYTPEITYYYRPGGKLADANLYKTIDILDAHKDRNLFFENVFDIGISNGMKHQKLDLKNYDEISKKLKVYCNEMFVLLHTYMRVIEQSSDKEKQLDLLKEMKVILDLHKMHLMAYDFKFIKQVVTFIDIWTERLK